MFKQTRSNKDFNLNERSFAEKRKGVQICTPKYLKNSNIAVLG
jgi:hypothetical protein